MGGVKEHRNGPSQMKFTQRRIRCSACMNRLSEIQESVGQGFLKEVVLEQSQEALTVSQGVRHGAGRLTQGERERSSQGGRGAGEQEDWRQENL